MSNTVDISNSPYYDDFNESKKYIQLLALPGRAEQAREFTQVQTIMLNLLRKLAATVLKEGTIISGMSFTLNGTTMTVHEGQVYLEGIVHNFDESTIEVTGVGFETVGITLNKSIVTEEEDISLRDPAQGYENHGLPGAHRIKAVPVLTLNDSTSPSLYRFNDGVLQVEPVRGDAYSDLLARRTYDESGNYKVSGLQLSSQPRNESTVTLTVDAGKAYVMGYEVVKPAPAKIYVDRSLDSRLVQNEPKVYQAGTLSYPINNGPVKQVDRVVATVQVTQTITRGASLGGLDPLPQSPVVRVVSVVQGATTYASSTDYQLSSDSIDWSPGGVEPEVGSTYTVTWQYNKVLESGTDYTVTYGNGDPVPYYITFTNTGSKPVDDSTFDLDYWFYLARKDLVSLNRSGDIIITTGQSNTINSITTPVINDPTLLHLGTLYLAPNAPVGVANSYAITRLNMEDLQRVVSRVNDIEYNQALSDLDNQAMAGESPTALKGILSDGFIGTSKADLSHPQFSASFSFEEGALVLPPSRISVQTPTVNSIASSISKWGRVATLSYTEKVGASQIYSTGTMLVNPYNVFNKLAVVNLTPEIDNWVDVNTILVENTSTSVYTVHRWWYHGGNLWNETEKYLFNNLKLDNGQSWYGWDAKTGTVTSSTSRTVLDESVQYMRQRSVTIKAYNLIPNSDNLTAYFDNVKVILSPTDGTVSGTITGTIKSDANGYAAGVFTIPANIKVGTREVVLKNDNNTTSAPYTASGRNRVVETNVLHNRVTVTPYDPLAQSFQFSQDQVISSVGLFFANKDSSNAVVQVRNVVNGYPGQVVYAEKMIPPGLIITSPTGTLETKVSFDTPVYCSANTQYCVVIITDSNALSMHIAELGGQDLTSGAYVSRQPYVDGTLFSSSNAITWTAHQGKDLKFNIYTCSFQSSGVIGFDAVQGLTADRIIMLSEYLTPQKTGCYWEVKVDNGSYHPIDTYVDTDLSSVSGSVQLRATLSTEDSNVSPVVAIDTLSLVSYTTSLSGSYVGRNAVMAQPYTIVKQIFEAHIPTGCTVIPQFATDATGSNWIPSTLVSAESVDGYYTRYTYQTTLGYTSTNFRPKLVMTSSSQLGRPKVRKLMNIIK